MVTLWHPLHLNRRIVLPKVQLKDLIAGVIFVLWIQKKQMGLKQLLAAVHMAKAYLVKRLRETAAM